jgi:hypothetical protein
MAFFDAALPLFGQLSKYRTEMSFQFAIQYPSYGILGWKTT